jgi:hypothetical protein
MKLKHNAEAYLKEQLKAEGAGHKCSALAD